MGIASLILGIISLVISWIPFVCFFSFILAVVGLILGIVDSVKKSKTNDKNKGIGIAGLVISAIAIPIIIIMSIFSIGITAAIIEDTDYDYDRNYNHDYSYDYDYDDWYDDWYDNYYNKLNYYDII